VKNKEPLTNKFPFYNYTFRGYKLSHALSLQTRTENVNLEWGIYFQSIPQKNIMKFFKTAGHMNSPDHFDRSVLWGGLHR